MTKSRFKACVFDAYGTLFDVHSAVAKHQALLGEQAAEISKLWRTKQLEYSWVRSLMRRHKDFWELTEVALDYALASYNVRDDKLRAALLESYLSLNAYAEVPSVLEGLRAVGFKIAILSNGSPFMLERAVHSAGLSDLIDKCLSIEGVRIYKPDPAAYELATLAFSMSADQIAFFSSNAWDAIGAHTFGFGALWINRSGQPSEYDLRNRVNVVTSLDEGSHRLMSGQLG